MRLKLFSLFSTFSLFSWVAPGGVRAFPYPFYSSNSPGVSFSCGTRLLSGHHALSFFMRYFLAGVLAPALYRLALTPIALVRCYLTYFLFALSSRVVLSCCPPALILSCYPLAVSSSVSPRVILIRSRYTLALSSRYTLALSSCGILVLSRVILSRYPIILSRYPPCRNYPVTLARYRAHYPRRYILVFYSRAFTLSL